MEDLAIMMLSVTLSSMMIGNLPKDKDSFTKEEIMNASMEASKQLISELKVTKEEREVKNITLPKNLPLN